jgi:hypothetical protein
VSRRTRAFACAAFAAVAFAPAAVPAFAVQQPAAPSALLVHAFRPHETIKRTLVHDSAGPDGPTTFHGVAEAVVDTVSDDTVVARVTVSGNGHSFGDEYRLDRRTLHLHDKSGTDTSATTSSFFNPVLYGVPSDPLSVGKTWQTSIGAWLYGPAGTSTVRVAAVDRAKHTLRLELTGSGNGTIGNDLKNPQNLLVTINGKSAYQVKREEGRSDWHGYVELADGIVQHSVLVMQTHLVTPSTPESPKHNDVETVTLESKLLEIHR